LPEFKYQQKEKWKLETLVVNIWAKGLVGCSTFRKIFFAAKCLTFFAGGEKIRESGT